MKLVGNIELQKGDALIVVDVQRDFLPDGSLVVVNSDEVVPVLNRYIQLFHVKRLPIYATRDWHPLDHCSFIKQGGKWPPHCIAGSDGALFPDDLTLPRETIIISKAQHEDKDAYSGFDGTDLAERLHKAGTIRLFIGGLATDYCVLNTVRDALAQDFRVLLLKDGARAVEVQQGDGDRAERKMEQLGARLINLASIAHGMDETNEWVNPKSNIVEVEYGKKREQ